MSICRVAHSIDHYKFLCIATYVMSLPSLDTESVDSVIDGMDCTQNIPKSILEARNTQLHTYDLSLH